MTRAEKAVSYHQSGFNCCQAVLLAFSDRIRISEEVMKRLGSSLGGGMYCEEATCGALIGAQMVQGMELYKGEKLKAESKALLEAFKAKVGASRCGAIKRTETQDPLYSCDDCIRYAVEAVEAVLQK